MREFKCSTSTPKTVDLDDPKIYSHLPKTAKELRNLMFREIGYATLYMDYYRKGVFPIKRKKDKFIKLSEFNPEAKNGDKLIEINNTGYDQRKRVCKLIDDFVNGERGNFDSVTFYREQVFLFQDEIENML